MPRLVMTSDEYARIRRHLFLGETEQAAFALAKPVGPTDGDLHVSSIHLVPNQDFIVQNEYHIEINPRAIETMIKAAFDASASIVEFHSHRSRYPACFSLSDMRGFREVVPHVRWRLGARPYVAVVHHDNSLDALVWSGDGEDPQQLGAVLAGTASLHPTGRTLTQPPPL